MDARFRVLFCLTVFLILNAVVGCSSPVLKVGLSSTANINVNDHDEPLPVVVRIYQLSEAHLFEQASFDRLWKNDVLALGETLVMKEELIISPADQRRFAMSRHDQAKYVAAVAIFRNPGEEGWKAIQPLSTNFLTRRMSSHVRVSLKGTTIALDE